MDFFLLLYLNTELGRSINIPFGFEAGCKLVLLACYEITK